jgi:hypothetical protein
MVNLINGIGPDYSATTGSHIGLGSSDFRLKLVRELKIVFRQIRQPIKQCLLIRFGQPSDIFLNLFEC